MALEYASLLLCDFAESEPCGKCQQCLTSLKLQHPDLHMAFPTPTRKSKSTDDDERKSRSTENDDREFSEIIGAYLTSLAKDPYKPLQPPKEQKDGSRSTRSSEIRVPTIRNLLHKAAMKPYQARCKVLVILNADDMNTQAQNSLLKALEEPWPDAYFLLTTENDGGLLQTIRSRCQRIRMAPLASVDIAQALVASGMAPAQAELAAAMSGGSYLHARELSKDDLTVLQKQVIAFLRAAAVCDPMELPKAILTLMDDSGFPEQTALEFISLFLRDVAFLQTKLGHSGIATFRGFEDRIEAVLQSYPQANFDRAARAVDITADYLQRGYSRDYVMYALAIRLHEALGPRAAAKSKQTKAGQHV